MQMPLFAAYTAPVPFIIFRCYVDAPTRRFHADYFEDDEAFMPLAAASFSLFSIADISLPYVTPLTPLSPCRDVLAPCYAAAFRACARFRYAASDARAAMPRVMVGDMR